MPPKSKSIFRQPGAQHFQLVHRSQRDPLINDPEASTHVLKPFERENVKKGKSRVDLEQLLSPADLTNERANIGEASLYGIYYDDTDYDYMRHLRTVGVQEDGVESVLIEAPTTSKKSKHKEKINVLDLPDGVLASTTELPRTYESQQAVPESIAGFQPDLDPHLRQVLEALEDDAFVDDDLEDDFFDELVADGERASDEEMDFEFAEDGVQDEPERADGAETSWERRFAQFKKSHTEVREESDDGFESEGGDTVGTLPAFSVIGGKKRRKGTSDASGYSMSSSSMYRNEALQTLDERFDQMISKQYNEEHDEPIDSNGDGDSDEAPELITSREDFDSMVKTFLNDFEILGRKMKPKMEGDNGVEKLEIMRRAMGQDDRVRVMNAEEDNRDGQDNDLFSDDDIDEKDRWDCESILTTYSNLENHPRLIRARNPKPAPKIVLDRKTGMPSILTIAEKERKPSSNRVAFAGTSDDTSDSDDVTERGAIQTIVRPRNELKDDKKARKAAVKADKQLRRAEKKSRKEQFNAEMKDQKRTISSKEVKMKKL